MINLKAKDYFSKANYWKKFLFQTTGIVILTYIFFAFIIFKNLNIDVYSLSLVILFCYFSFLYSFNKIYNFWLFRKCYRLMMEEVYQIQKEVKLPSKLPKVVYVYTTHNDFWKARLLQSMQQTYKNIEYWISDGSSNQEKSKEIQDFCKKYNVKYYSLKRPSINKADNLNHFLKHAKVKFDYLLISDSDVAIDKNFVTTSLKYFYYKKFKRLGWVTSLINSYPHNNLYNYLSKNIENRNGFYNLEINFSLNRHSPLHSSCSLISKELLKDFDMQFPDSCLEDFWLEFLSLKKYYCGFKNPISISMEAFDMNILSRMTRLSRVYDWLIKLSKEHYWKNLNESKKFINNDLFNIIWYEPLKWIFYPLLWSTIIFIFINFNQLLFHHYEYVVIVSCILFCFLIHFTIEIIKSFRIFKWHFFQYSIMAYLNNFALFLYRPIHFFNAFFRSKYSDFTSSRISIKNKKITTLYKSRQFIILFMISATLLTIFDILFILLRWNTLNMFLMFIFIYVNFVLSLIILSIITFFFLYSLSWIRKKSNDPNEFIYCKNERMIAKSNEQKM